MEAIEATLEHQRSWRHGGEEIQSAQAPWHLARAVMHPSNGSGVAEAPSVSGLVWKPSFFGKGGQTGTPRPNPEALTKRRYPSPLTCCSPKEDHAKRIPFSAFVEARPASDATPDRESASRRRTTPNWEVTLMDFPVKRS
jgi:hypothetical protein